MGVSSLMAALLPFSPLAAVPPPLGAKVLTSDPPPIVREKAMQRHERAGREDESWPPPKYKQLKKLAPKAEMTNLVLVLGGMVNQKDLDLAGEWIKETGAHLMLYNNDASGTDDCKNGTSNGVWCGQSCDQLRLRSHVTRAKVLQQLPKRCLARSVHMHGAPFATQAAATDHLP